MRLFITALILTMTAAFANARLQTPMKPVDSDSITSAFCYYNPATKKYQCVHPH